MHTRLSETENDQVVLVKLNKHGIDTVFPRSISLIDYFNSRDGQTIQDPLILRSGDGWLTLQDGIFRGGSTSSLGHSEDRIRYFRAVSTGSHGADFSEVHGMSSTIDGLAEWAELTPVSQELRFRTSDNRLDEVVIRARNLEPLSLGGPLDLRLITSYTHNPDPIDGTYRISTSIEIRTQSQNPASWEKHAQVHRMVQDLMCLVFGRPCLSKIVSVMREDDQDFEPVDQRRLWRDAFEPAFGRTSSEAVKLAANDRPLFYYSDADPRKVSEWLDSYSIWARTTWIGVTTLFYEEMPIEARLLQIAVSLEALSAAIAEADNQAAPNNFVDMLELVCKSLTFEPEQIFEERSIREWCIDFNRAYKGVKHADNQLPAPLVALRCADQGMTLMRCWLGIKLGVSAETLSENLSLGR